MSPDPSSKTIILQKSLELFTEKSYHKVSIAEIADNIPNIEKSTIFYHFKSKLNLANQVIDYLIREFEGEQMQLFMIITDPKEKLEKIIDSMINLTQIYPNMMNFVLEVMEENQKVDQKLDAFSDLITGYGAIVTSILEECRVPNPQDRALILLSALDGVAIYGALFSDNLFFEKLYGSDFFIRFKKELLNIILRP